MIKSDRELLREALAEYAHMAWAGWMDYMFIKSSVNPDGSVMIPRELVVRWMRQAETAYTDLPEHEKQSDRDEADKILIRFQLAGIID